jgi:putative transposase
LAIKNMNGLQRRAGALPLRKLITNNITIVATMAINNNQTWHTTAKLTVRGNITLVPLPPASPERNAEKNIWQYLRQTCLSNRVFADYAAILDACQDAWRKLRQETGRIATRQWAVIGQSQ